MFSGSITIRKRGRLVSGAWAASISPPSIWRRTSFRRFTSRYRPYTLYRIMSTRMRSSTMPAMAQATCARRDVTHRRGEYATMGMSTATPESACATRNAGSHHAYRNSTSTRVALMRRKNAAAACTGVLSCRYPRR
jgi:hypothetical protein